MGWEQVKRDRRKFGGPLCGVRVGVTVTNKGKASLRFSIGGDVLKALEWELGRLCNVFLGTGEDDGRVLIAAAGDDADTAYKLSNVKSSISGTIVVPAWQGLPDWRCKAQSADWKVDNDGLVVTLPAFPAKPETVDKADPPAVPDEAVADAESDDEPAPLDELEDEVLQAVIANPGLRPQALADETGIVHATLLRRLRYLAEKGYIVQRGDEITVVRHPDGSIYEHEVAA